jgi:uncharacterized membrane protein YphA (DoxX/SURF4 family)
MLNVFPIQFLAPLAYFILRVLYGLYLIRLGERSRIETKKVPTLPLKARVTYSIATILTLLSALSLILGFLTQIGAVVSGVLALIHMRKDAHAFLPVVMPRSSALLSLAISLTLFITGGGAFAVDLPI